MRTKLLILSIIVSAGFSLADDAVLFGNVRETDLILTPEGVTNAILTTALTVEADPVAYPIATNALALAEGAVAHAESAHGVTDNGGFAGGSGAYATEGGAVGYYAYAADGGAVGSGAYATEGGAVGYYANAMYGGAVGSSAIATTGGAVGNGANAMDGGAIGSGAYATEGGAVGNGAIAMDGGAVGDGAVTSSGFAGGYMAMAALDNTGYGQPIDAIQLGTGWNPDANTLQVYSYKLLNADGSIPAERMAATLSGYATTGAVAAVQAEVLDPWIDWSAIITPINGTATVTRATGADPVLVLTDDVVISVPTSGWPATGVARVSFSLWAGTHSVTFLTNTVEYSSTPSVSTNDWTTILFRRTGDQAKWKGVGL